MPVPLTSSVYESSFETYKACLLGIKLDNELFLHRHGQVVSLGETFDISLHTLLIELQPLWDASSDNCAKRVIDELDFPAFFPCLDTVSHFDQEGRDVDFPAVYLEMAVPHKMSSLRT